MNNEITLERIKRIRYLVSNHFNAHMEACSECQWVEEEEEIDPCERAQELNHILGKWRKHEFALLRR